MKKFIMFIIVLITLSACSSTKHYYNNKCEYKKIPTGKTFYGMIHHCLRRQEHYRDHYSTYYDPAIIGNHNHNLDVPYYYDNLPQHHYQHHNYHKF